MMSPESASILDMQTHTELDALAREAGEEILSVPTTLNGDIELGNFRPDRTPPTTAIKVTILPERIDLEMIDGALFGILNEYPDFPIQVLRQAVGHLALCRGSEGWAIEQDPDLSIENGSGFNIFLQLITHHVGMRRRALAQQATQRLTA